MDFHHSMPLKNNGRFPRFTAVPTTSPSSVNISPLPGLSTSSDEENSWEVDEEQFNIFLAVPENKQVTSDSDETTVIKYAEHFTLSDEMIALMTRFV